MSTDHDTQNTVVYKDIPGFPGYRAGSDGTIWSCWKHRGHRKGVLSDNWHMIKPIFYDHSKINGRYMIVLPDEHNKRRFKTVAMFVMLAFRSPRPDGKNALHWDDNPANNKLENLRWGTPFENSQDRIRNGNSMKGSKNATSKLNEEQVKEIKIMINEGYNDAYISKFYVVNRTAIHKIRIGESWKHVTL